MIVPDGYYVIYQPKHRIPGVFDLNERGMFKTCPFVTENRAYRIIANADLDAKLEYLCLVEKNITDQITGESYSFVVEKELIDLDEELNLRSDDLSMHVPDTTFLNWISEVYGQWRSSYIPNYICIS
ncbi:MAG: hypothetical protein KKC46_10330 [Proteobacteria bacterium]|nr:hypothetical protein [Pseudomonadota bacterium]